MKVQIIHGFTFSSQICLLQFLCFLQSSLATYDFDPLTFKLHNSQTQMFFMTEIMQLYLNTVHHFCYNNKVKSVSLIFVIDIFDSHK